MTARYDVVIAGAGVVGAALALMLRDAQLNVVVVAPSLPITSPPGTSEPAPVRPIALASPSCELLHSLGLIEDSPGTPIHTIHVSSRGRFGRTVLSASEHGIPSLGQVVDAAALEQHASRAAAPFQIPGHVEHWNNAGDGVTIAIRHDNASMPIQARLLVLADGGALAPQDTVHDYHQVAWFGTVRTTRAHANVAYERFTREGPLALLPFRDRYAFVWATSSAHAATMPADDHAFCAALANTFGERQGHFHEPSSRACMPLLLKRAQTLNSAGAIAIGNASQTLHPVAGQGLNLGLRDASELASAIRSGTPESLGTAQFTAAFSKKRRMDRAATMQMTDLLARLFATNGTLASIVGGVGLATIDALPPARAFLARRMLLGARALP
jgi:2-octaprenyl-6-methoxyphenol hydroxylase